MLSKGDEYPIHQTPEPIAFSGTDRNFYDRYFFNGYASDPDAVDTDFFALAFGVYPHLNVADAHFSVVRAGKQHCIHASRLLAMERMDLHVGPIRIEIVEPLKCLRLIIAEQDGVSADLMFTGRAFPVEEPRFTRRIGPRTFMDYTRMTQNGRWTGWIEIDGIRQCIDGAVGTRDRSWGIRPIGLPDQQPNPPVALPQFFWLWSPLNFSHGSAFFHNNADGTGSSWNTRAVWCDDGAEQGDAKETSNCGMSVRLKPGWRHAESAELSVGGDAPFHVHFEPRSIFLMRGIGYGHPEWTHGAWKGDLVVERELIDLSKIEPGRADHLHIQALSRVTLEKDGLREVGVGILEQLIIGPYAPLRLKSLFGD
jgi:hypothetical protein